jgi:organic radical activating enzyme
MISYKKWKILSEAVWNGKKDDIINFWKTLNPTKIQIDPILAQHKGSTFTEDGIRITGEPKFIYSVISHLKQFLEFENNQTKLEVKFKETESQNQKKPNKKSYSFYIQVKNRK